MMQSDDSVDYLIYYRPPIKLQKGNVFSRVSLSVHKRQIPVQGSNHASPFTGHWPRTPPRIGL